MVYLFAQAFPQRTALGKRKHNAARRSERFGRCRRSLRSSVWGKCVPAGSRAKTVLGADMEKILSPEFSEPLTQFHAQPPVAGEYTENAEFISCNLSQQSFRKSEFYAVKFVGCRFTGTDLSRADFCNAEFRDCDFSGASAVEARFDRAYFCGCKGLGTSFAEGEFADVRLERCNFMYANFSGSKFRSVLFSNVIFPKAPCPSAK